MSDNRNQLSQPADSVGPEQGEPASSSLFEDLGGYDQAHQVLANIAGLIADPATLLAYVAEGLRLPFGIPFIRVGTELQDWDFLRETEGDAASFAEQQGWHGTGVLYIGPGAVPYAQQHFGDLVTALAPDLTAEQEAALRALLPPDVDDQGNRALYSQRLR